MVCGEICGDCKHFHGDNTLVGICLIDKVKVFKYNHKCYRWER